MPRTSFSRLGFTLIELLVVIAIIAILIALLVPAVQKVRSAAAKLECENNLRQLGIALHGFHNDNKAFPSGVTVEGPSFAEDVQSTWAIFILPYIDQVPLFQMYDFSKGYGNGSEGKNIPVFSYPITVYQCPAGGGGKLSVYGFHSNYVACSSADGRLMEVNGKLYANAPDTFNSPYFPPTKISLFNWNVRRSIGNVTDGTSNTAAISEVIAGPMGALIQGKDDGRGCWFRHEGALYSHMRLPNTPIPDSMMYDTGQPGWPPYNCVPGPDFPCVDEVPSELNDMISARSRHAGGVNVLFVDGSVRFITNNISLPAWQAIGSIQGGETIDAYF